MNEQVMKILDCWRRAYRFINDEDGEIYFWKHHHSVGGAHLEMVTAASNINLWKEWAY
jgi:hypothetical protein